MPWVGLEPTIPELERPKKIYALERAATVIGSFTRIIIEELFFKYSSV
jgi:hypothetical protein